ncbi:unnamed protein product [Phaedon cochleariae]|uniref:UBZ1-type domain-containing protein n=1 Tax=Phaedon cochleariae TaxID=80249 RepID=A0A9P0GRS0_PHACE|nr:unnamed protein product [Phaedon cochleariae]
MDESLGAQYAIQIAVHTLRDRCKNLQQRIATLEDENVALRSKCTQIEENEQHSLSEMDKLRVQIAETTEQHEQLQDRVRMVSSENQDLWGKLGKLIDINKNLRNQLNKINETVDQHITPTHTVLIRSKTFTQHEPQTKFPQKNLDINEKISLELENISLKLTDNFSKQKIELERMCSEIDEMQCDNGIITENFGFCFDDQLEEDVVDDLNVALEDLRLLKEQVLTQKEILEKNLRNMQTIQNNKALQSCKSCDMKRIHQCEKATSTVDIPKTGVDKCTEALLFGQDEKSSSKLKQSTEVEKICPICSRHFKKDTDFIEFQQHVENHFIVDSNSHEIS